MAFKRTYEVENENTLYSKVLVQCDTCGAQDSLTEEFEVKPVNGTFHDVEDISVHSTCSICGEHEWVEFMEIIRLKIPEQLQPKTYTINTLNELVNEVETFHTLISAAQNEGFGLKNVEDVVVLTKEQNTNLPSPMFQK